jgi:fumarate reductase subunit C
MAYRRQPHFAWWWGHRAYTLFVLRELTSVFIGAYAILLLLLIYRLGQGREAYEAYLRFLSTPWMVAFHVVTLAAAVYHSITWFALSPKATAVRLGGRQLPGRVIVTGNVVVWLLVSIIVAWIILRP